MKFEQFSLSAFGNDVTIPVLRFGDGIGKRLVLMGGVHGDEVNGIYNLKVIIEKLKDLDSKGLIKGEIICFPIVNPDGFIKGKRSMFGRDLNRSYFTSKLDFFASHFASKLFDEYISKADYAIDFHDSGSTYELSLHSRVNKKDNVLLEMSQALQLDAVLVRKPTTGMLADMADKNSVKFLTIESGGGGLVNYKYSKQILKGFINFLRVYGFYEDSKALDSSSVLNKYKSRHKLKMSNAFVIKKHVSLSQKVKKGDLLLDLYDPANQEFHKVYSNVDAFVFSTPIGNSIGAGNVLIDLALDYDIKLHGGGLDLFKIVKISI